MILCLRGPRVRSTLLALLLSAGAALQAEGGPIASSGSLPPPRRVWANTCGDDRVDSIIDDFEDLSPWLVCCSDDNLAAVELRPSEGCHGQALAIDYDLNGGDWLVVLRSFDPPLNLTPFTHLRLGLHGTNLAAHQNVQVKLADASGNVRWYVGESISDLPVWRVVYIDLRGLTCFGDDATCQDPPPLQVQAIVRIELGIARCLRKLDETLVECEGNSDDASVVHFDELAAVDLRPGAPNRLPPRPREKVWPNKAIRASTAAALRDLGERNGLVPAWYDEPVPNYNTYSQALRILVLAQEPRTPMNRTALENAVTTMLNLQISEGRVNGGAWFTQYRWDGTQFVAPENCSGDETLVEHIDRCAWIGNVGWMLIALDRVKSARGHPDRTAIDRAIERAADWIGRQLGRLPEPDFMDVASYGLEGNISAYFGLLAARRKSEARRLEAALYRLGWDPVERRMKTGIRPTDLVTAMDTAGSWGAELLRCMGKERDARASQAYVASVMRTTSFDGAVEGYGDLNGPWTMTVEFGAQGASAGIPGARHVLEEIHPLQAADGSFAGSTDDFLGAGAWTTTWHGVAPTAWVYLSQTRSPLSRLCSRRR